MREIRLLRLTRRRLETEPGHGLRHRTGPDPDRQQRLPVLRAPRQPPTLPPRIQSELALLGVTVAESTVAKYMSRQRKSPSPTWRTFLEHHLSEIVAIDFFVVATVSFRLLYGFIVLRGTQLIWATAGFTVLMAIA